MLQSKLVKHLLEEDERDIADWFKCNVMEGNAKSISGLDKGFVGAPNNKMGKVSFYKYMKNTTSGKMGVFFAFFTGAMCRCMKDISD